MIYDCPEDGCDFRLVVDIPDDVDPLLRMAREGSYDRAVAEHAASHR